MPHNWHEIVKSGNACARAPRGSFIEWKCCNCGARYMSSWAPSKFKQVTIQVHPRIAGSCEERIAYEIIGS